MESAIFLQNLIKEANQIAIKVEKLKEIDINLLSKRPIEGGWNILECIEHLNLYGDFYLIEIQKSISNAKQNQGKGQFKSGWLGNYFAKSMLPKSKLNKMKTFKDKDPIYANLNASVIDKFLAQQQILINLLNQAENIDINIAKVNISISKWIKLKLGDTFQFYINHIIRHLNQIDRIIADF